MATPFQSGIGDPTRAGLEAAACLTALGDETATWRGLGEGSSALCAWPVRGEDGGEPVPLGLRGPMECEEPPRWMLDLTRLAAAAGEHGDWGKPEYPVFLTSSNFSIESLYASRVLGREDGPTVHGAIHRCADHLRSEFGWGNNLRIISHACVSAALGLKLGAAMLRRRPTEKVLVFSFDYLSAFVTAGFHALKILNAGFPRPFQVAETGSVALGDGAGFAVLTAKSAPLEISGQGCWNEMVHLTGNEATGSGFTRMAEELTSALRGRKAWIRGHGTGTLESGRMECESWARALPEAPLVGWKGGIGHTLGSCGIVELAIATVAMREGKAPGTVGSAPPFFSEQVRTEAFSISEYDAAVLTANAFGGAHSGLVLSYG